MKKHQTLSIKAAYFFGAQLAAPDNEYTKEAALKQAAVLQGAGSAFSSGVSALGQGLAQGLGFVAAASPGLIFGLGSLLFGFAMGAAALSKPLGETIGTNLKAAPFIPLSDTQIRNVLVQNTLLRDSRRLRKQKERQLSELAEKLIKERYQIDE